MGRATSLRLAQDGRDLVLGYVRDEPAAATTRSEAEALGVTCSTVRADLTTDSGIDELFDAATSRAGRIDAVVNNAGATFRISSLAETPPPTCRRRRTWKAREDRVHASDGPGRSARGV
ncbi:SDR family oxidoreductase [Brachybacterium sp. HMSC06H03]|uniref:SDR family oxidoreductase n=1 Tax=Brachybacterium sp. HMSC06H03 TaxID=1581127 RepID=UPI0009F6B93A